MILDLAYITIFLEITIGYDGGPISLPPALITACLSRIQFLQFHALFDHTVLHDERSSFTLRSLYRSFTPRNKTLQLTFASHDTAVWPQSNRTRWHAPDTAPASRRAAWYIRGRSSENRLIADFRFNHFHVEPEIALHAESRR